MNEMTADHAFGSNPPHGLSFSHGPVQIWVAGLIDIRQVIFHVDLCQKIAGEIHRV